MLKLKKLAAIAVGVVMLASAFAVNATPAPDGYIGIAPISADLDSGFATTLDGSGDDVVLGGDDGYVGITPITGDVGIGGGYIGIDGGGALDIGDMALDVDDEAGIYPISGDLDENDDEDDDNGISTGLIIALVVAGVVLLAIIILFVAKKKD